MNNLRQCLFVIFIMAEFVHGQDGATLFKTYCALCHEGTQADAQAPGREVLKRMSAEQVLQSLERGSMRLRAAERSRAQRRIHEQLRSRNRGRHAVCQFRLLAPSRNSAGQCHACVFSGVNRRGWNREWSLIA